MTRKPLVMPPMTRSVDIALRHAPPCVSRRLGDIIVFR